MKVWLVNISEPVPMDGGTRLFRASQIANKLVGNGHKVLLWKSSFNHVSKIQRVNKNTILEYKENYKIYFIKTIPYYKNNGFMRIINHLQFARKFAKLAEKEDPPDLILTSYPDIFHSYKAVKYGKKHNIPVVVDVRDMWPEAFVEVMPKFLKPVAKVFLSPIYLYVNYIFRNATAVISMLPFCLQWYQNLSNRKHREFDRVFHHAYKKLNPTHEELEESYSFWKKYGLEKDSKDFIVCFFGSIGSKTVVDLDTVIKAGKLIESKTDKIKFILCGSGQSLNYYKSIAKGCKNIIFPGWIDANKIYTLLEMGAVGIIPYRNRFDFKNTIPNKAAEYLSGGLPILTCMDGYINEFLKPYGCVFHYKEDNSDELANIILDLYSNPQKLKHSSVNAFKAYNNHFNSDKVYTEMINYFEKVLNQSKLKFQTENNLTFNKFYNFSL